MNDFAMYDLAQQRYADVCRAVRESRRPIRTGPGRGRHWLAAVSQALVARLAALGLKSRPVVPHAHR